MADELEYTHNPKLYCAVRWLAGMVYAETGFQLACHAFDGLPEDLAPPGQIKEVTQESLQHTTANIERFCAMFEQSKGAGGGDAMRRAAMHYLESLAESKPPKP